MNKNNNIDYDRQEFKGYSIEAVDLLQQMMQTYPDERISAQEALTHEFFDDQIIQIKKQMSEKEFHQMFI